MLSEIHYWFSVSLTRLHKGTTSYTKRSGTLNAATPLEAMNKVYDQYTDPNDWKIESARICTVDKSGEVVATSEKNTPTHTCEKPSEPKGVVLNDWASRANINGYPTESWKEIAK
jgi:hypothetical protein